MMCSTTKIEPKASLIPGQAVCLAVALELFLGGEQRSAGWFCQSGDFFLLRNQTLPNLRQISGQTGAEGKCPLGGAPLMIQA